MTERAHWTWGDVAIVLSIIGAAYLAWRIIPTLIWS